MSAAWPALVGGRATRSSLIGFNESLHGVEMTRAAIRTASKRLDMFSLLLQGQGRFTQNGYFPQGFAAQRGKESLRDPRPAWRSENDRTESTDENFILMKHESPARGEFKSLQPIDIVQVTRVYSYSGMSGGLQGAEFGY